MPRNSTYAHETNRYCPKCIHYPCAKCEKVAYNQRRCHKCGEVYKFTNTKVRDFNP